MDEMDPALRIINSEVKLLRSELKRTRQHREDLRAALRVVTDERDRANAAHDELADQLADYQDDTHADLVERVAKAMFNLTANQMVKAASPFAVGMRVRRWEDAFEANKGAYLSAANRAVNST